MTGVERDRGTLIVGLMSGTSLDGIASAVVRFSETENQVHAELVGFSNRAYTREERERLARALVEGSPADYCRLNFDLGEWLANAAMNAIAEAGVSRSEVAAIASHGQSIWHEPGHSTWQTGESSVIAERVGVPVVSDFRVRDVAAGGQGAPLVSMADATIFASPTDWRGLQNLGGIGNVTVVPPGGDVTGVRAFDTGPGAGVIDKVTRKLFPDLRFDEDGKLAAAGSPVSSVVTRLLEHPYFAAEPPKSTGPELFSPHYVDELIASCRSEQAGCTDEDIIATAVELTARSIADSYRRFIAEPIAETILSGGGAKNPTLVKAITAALDPLPVRLFDDVFFDGEAKEAVAFALLGYLHLKGRPGNVRSATGARGARILGKLTPP
ncbi:MAG TPA: anhydro-N-acetylmuramic acid kinase [Gemmatimonadaceae bacterium]|nr:anhydro-N-acetylmuramic acid kinase [Gemmatimonadaceae bacterium]